MKLLCSVPTVCIKDASQTGYKASVWALGSLYHPPSRCQPITGTAPRDLPPVWLPTDSTGKAGVRPGLSEHLVLTQPLQDETELRQSRIWLATSLTCTRT